MMLIAIRSGGYGHEWNPKIKQVETQESEPIPEVCLFQDYWSPKIVGELNDSYVKLVKLKGEFVWHRHMKEDELFLVTKGQLTIKLRGKDVVVRKAEFLVVPRGVEHKQLPSEKRM
jgi:mannose-6-phosphate isomerase-like protein (cupin superfamily)